MFSRRAASRRPQAEGSRSHSPSESAPTPADGHVVALLRRPTIGGRIVLLLAIGLAVGPGGTWLFRVTQSLFAADGLIDPFGDGVGLESASGPAGKKGLPSQSGDGSHGGSRASGRATSASRGGEAAPSWDLTQQAADAWMIVDRPQSDGSSQANEGRPTPALPNAALPNATRADADGRDAPLPILSLDPSAEPARLAGDDSAVPAAPVGTNSLRRKTSPTRSLVELTSDRHEITIRPRTDELVEIRQSWQGLDEEYFDELELAPVAPPATFAPLSPVAVDVDVDVDVGKPAKIERETTAPPVADAFSPPETQSGPTEATSDDGPVEPTLVNGPTEPAMADTPPGAAIEGVPIEDPYAAAPVTMLSPAFCEAGPRPVLGVHCNGETDCQDLEWQDSWLIPWEVFAQGEYVGPSRTPHVPEYRLRVDDQIEFVYRLTGEKSAGPYRINTGDTLRIESLTAETLNREALVQPDGTISLTHLGQVPVAGRSIAEVRDDLETRYAEHIRNPAITVTPVRLNTVLEELRATVDSRFGNGGQSRLSRVTPEGTVQLVAVGSVPAHGLTLDELRAEVQYRYADIVGGLEVTPILFQRAPRYVFVLGEVRVPGRFILEGPTTLMQAIAMAGGWNVGANLKQVVVFRRDECWRLMATKVNVRRPLYGKDPCPNGELWLRDSDIVVLPKAPILVVDEFIDLVFTRGVYGVIPFSSNLSYVRNLSGGASSVIPIP